MVVVQDLFVYPVKSARGIARSRALLTTTGFEWDRQWMAVDATGTFVSQRTHPRLARVAPAIAGDSLTLTARNLKPLPAGVSLNFIDAAKALDESERWNAQYGEIVLRGQH